MNYPEKAIRLQVRVQATDCYRNKGDTVWSQQYASGLTVEQDLYIKPRDFASVAKILGKFQDLADAVNADEGVQV